MPLSNLERGGSRVLACKRIAHSSELVFMTRSARSWHHAPEGISTCAAGKTMAMLGDVRGVGEVVMMREGGFFRAGFG